MAKIKYDNSDIDDVLDNIPVGLYRFKVTEIEDGKSESSGNRRLAVTLSCLSKADGSKADCAGMNGWIYPQPPQEDQHPYVKAQWKQFCAAVGLGEKGTLDTDKVVKDGTVVLGQVKLDRKSDEPDRTRITKIMALPAGDEDDEDDDDGDELDIDTATAKELKAYIKDNDLDVDAKLPLKKLRAAVAEALEADDDDDDDDDDEVDLDEMDMKELKAFIKENDLDVKVKKSDDEDDVRAKIAEASEDEDDEDDDDDDDEDGDDYDEWSVEDLKNELKSRNLKTSGKADQLRQRLRKDDEDDAF